MADIHLLFLREKIKKYVLIPATVHKPLGDLSSGFQALCQWAPLQCWSISKQGGPSSYRQVLKRSSVVGNDIKAEAAQNGDRNNHHYISKSQEDFRREVMVLRAEQVDELGINWHINDSISRVLCFVQLAE